MPISCYIPCTVSPTPENKMHRDGLLIRCPLSNSSNQRIAASKTFYRHENEKYDTVMVDNGEVAAFPKQEKPL